MPANSISTAIAVRISPINRSNAIITRGPSARCIRSALNSMISHMTATSDNAATCSITSVVLVEEKSSTVANADGPANAGIASGTINGSCCESVVSPNTPPGCGNTMRIAIRNRITPPPMRRETSDNCMAARKCRPKNMNRRSNKNAIAHSRTTTRQRFSAGTFANALANSGTLPNGSVTRNSRMND